MFHGSIVALITPFKGGEIDFGSFDRLIEFHLANRTSALLLCGSTGEGTSLNNQERDRMFKRAKSITKGQTPLVLGASTNQKESLNELIEVSNSNKADAMLVCPPFYVKPSQNSLVSYYKYIAEKSDAPLIIYNIPGRTSVTITPDTFEKLNKIANIKAVKESSSNLELCAFIISKTDLTLLSGDDVEAFHVINLGGKGVVSVAANVIPHTLQDMCDFLLNGNVKEGRTIHLQHIPLFKGLFVESNPMPVKFVLKHMGLIDSEECRFPLGSLNEQSKGFLQELKERIKIANSVKN